MELSALSHLPGADESRADSLLKEELSDFCRKIVVLDDDPTGIQTVHGIYVYTDWEEQTLLQAFEAQENMFFILTNSRSFSAAETEEVHRLIARRIDAAAKQTGKEYIVISRGDSTLRGHYPLETDTLRGALGGLTGTDFDGEILCPFFLEGGRYTIENVHYVKDGGTLIPAGDTEFAKDKTFGYHNSDLTAYIEEKSGGTVRREDCMAFSLEELRFGDIAALTGKLMSAGHYRHIIVNAADYTDIKIFCTALIRAMKQGKNFIVRSAAALPKILGGVPDQPLLGPSSLFPHPGRTGGLVIVGSHVHKTTSQLEDLMNSHQARTIHFMEFQVDTVFKGGLEAEASRILASAESCLRVGKSVVIYTSRQLLIPEGADKDAILAASVSISDALTSIVSRLTVKPRFILAKGGITSSDVGTKGLSVKKALVMGQIKKGIPVWLTGPESKFPDTPYIIFPGNVGDTHTLREIVEELS